jgi:tetratricopeptide (TPR) repeat protein
MVRAAGRPPTAAGSLEKTPLVHLLVYLADRKLTGSIILVSPSPNDPLEDVVYFSGGAAAKVRTGRPTARLGEVLVELGLLAEGTRQSSFDSAAKAGELHGKFLVRTGAIDQTSLSKGLAAQTARKMALLFRVPSDTTFSFFEGANLLSDWGGPELWPLDPLSQIWLAASSKADRRVMDATLARLGSTTLKLYEASPIERFGFGPAELRVVEQIRSNPATLVEVLTSQVAPDPTILLVVYVLLITRYLDHGSSAGPVAIDWAADPSRPKEAPPASAGVPFARVKLVARRAGTQAGENTPAAGRTALSAEVAARRDAIIKRAEAIDHESFFQMLGVEKDATEKVVQAAFFALAKIWHTDRLAPELADVRDACSKVFARMSEAFETLSNADRRKRYVDTLAGDTALAETEQVQRIIEAATQFQHAEVFLKKHDLVNAETCSKRAYGLDPDQTDYVALYAMVQLQKAGSDEPLDSIAALLDAAIAKNDKCERAYFARATLRKRLGRMELAIDDYRIAYELNPSNLDAAREVRLHQMRQGKSLGRGTADPPAQGASKTPSKSPSKRPSKAPSGTPPKKVGGLLSSIIKRSKR